MAPRAKSEKRRNTEARLLAAVGEVLAEEGFGAIGINTVARRAGVDKVLIYRYFGGLDGLFRAYGEQGDIWPSVEDFLGPAPETLAGVPVEEAAARVLVNFARALERRPLTLELLAWECHERNALTIALEEVREAQSHALFARLGELGVAMPSEQLVAAITLLSGAINYLSVRRRSIRVFGGTSLAGEDFWLRMRPIIQQMVTGFSQG